MDETGHPEPVQFPYSHLFKIQKSQGLTVSLSTIGTALAMAYGSNNGLFSHQQKIFKALKRTCT
jgi:hypothetical protein